MHHVIDARTGKPTSDLIATWAIASDTATADGLATGLFFDVLSPLMATFDFSFVRMFAGLVGRAARAGAVIDRFAQSAGELPYKKYRREDMERSQQARAATPGR